MFKIIGSRGTGKTTLLVKYLLSHHDKDTVLFVSYGTRIPYIVDTIASESCRNVISHPNYSFVHFDDTGTQLYICPFSTQEFAYSLGAGRAIYFDNIDECMDANGVDFGFTMN